ncbi:hypothetical protein BJX96DRAFT_143165, partial [Aspergillus floccosus]
MERYANASQRQYHGTFLRPVCLFHVLASFLFVTLSQAFAFTQFQDPMCEEVISRPGKSLGYASSM